MLFYEPLSAFISLYGPYEPLSAFISLYGPL
jgi:hypothetical protein